MGRAPCCDKSSVKRGPWSPEEDATLRSYVEKHGTGGNWIALPHKAGLRRCGKSCRLRWLNYLRPDIKHGAFSDEEDDVICSLFKSIGSRWSVIASHLPGRTDNDVKNHWNTKLKKKLLAGALMAATAGELAGTQLNRRRRIPPPPAPLPPLRALPPQQVCNFSSFAAAGEELYQISSWPAAAISVSPATEDDHYSAASSSSVTAENRNVGDASFFDSWPFVAGESFFAGAGAEVDDGSDGLYRELGVRAGQLAMYGSYS